MLTPQRAVDLRAMSARPRDHALGRSLPPVLALAADLGFALSLVLVLAGLGAAGLAAGIALGIASLAGVFVQLLPRGRAAILQAPGERTAYALASELDWDGESRRVA